jgi:hypothetical protein
VKAPGEERDFFAVPLKKSCKTQMLCHWPVGQHSASQQCSAPHFPARSKYLALVFFRLIPGPVSWIPCGQTNDPDWVRLALPRPPNLDSQYQRLQISCQEKNAKYGCRLRVMSICSGHISTEPYLSLVLPSKFPFWEQNTASNHLCVNRSISVRFLSASLFFFFSRSHLQQLSPNPSLPYRTLPLFLALGHNKSPSPEFLMQAKKNDLLLRDAQPSN